MRIHSLRLLRGLGAKDLIGYLYPRIFSLHNMPEEVPSRSHLEILRCQAGFPDKTGQFVLPPIVRATRQTLEDSGAYLLENGQTMILYLGRHVVPLLLNDLFGPLCNALADLDFQMTVPPPLDTPISIQLRNTIAYINETRPSRALCIQIARATMDGAEHEFSSLLVEDRNNEAQAYGEYLPYLHRQINMEVFYDHLRVKLGD